MARWDFVSPTRFFGIGTARRCTSVRGSFREGRRFITEALSRARIEGCNAALRGRALTSLGLIGLAQGDYQDASSAFEESLALLRAEGDPASVALVLSKYGATRLMMGDLDLAWTLVEEGYAMAQPLPLGITHSFVTSWRGWVARARGDMPTARFMHEENLRIGHALKNRTTIGHGHAFLAAVELADNRVDEAFMHFCEALPYHIELGDGWGLALDLEGLSAVASLRSRYADAVRLMGAVDALRERSAVALPASDAAIAPSARRGCATSSAAPSTRCMRKGAPCRWTKSSDSPPTRASSTRRSSAFLPSSARANPKRNAMAFACLRWARCKVSNRRTGRSTRQPGDRRARASCWSIC
jgi:tetratricopeptide (TPR) repeat protein